MARSEFLQGYIRMPGGIGSRDLNRYYGIQLSMKKQHRLLDVRLVFVALEVFHELVAQGPLLARAVVKNRNEPILPPTHTILRRYARPPAVRELKCRRHQHDSFYFGVARGV